MFARCLLAIGALALIPNASATLVTVSGTYNWTQVSDLTGDSADTQSVLDFAAVPGGLLYISGVTIDLGAGMLYDLEFGNPGWGPSWGAFSPSFGTTGGSTVTGPVSESHDPVSFVFTDFDPGETFAFGADIDRYPSDIGEALACVFTLGILCDDLSSSDFLDNGRAPFVITFSAIPGFSIVGPNTVTIGAGDACWVSAGNSSVDCDWSGTIEVLEDPPQQGDVPEPSSFFLLGSGLLGIGVATRRFRK